MKYAWLLLVVILVAACQQSKPAVDLEIHNNTSQQNDANSSIPINEPVYLTPRQTDVKELINAHNKFTFEFYNTVREKPGNIFVSPLSISTAFTMLERGARGDTSTEIQSALGNTEIADIDSTYRSLILSLNRSENYTLQMGNSLWIDEGFQVKPEYSSLLSRFYDASVTALDLQAAIGPASVNAWVNEKTRGLIPSIVDSFDEGTRAVLVNAIYFKGNWTNQFDASQSYTAPFFVRPDTSVASNFMTQQKRLMYGETSEAQVLELPYADGSVSMLLVLPHNNTSLTAMENSLNLEKYEELRSSMDEQNVIVKIPSFKLHWTAEIIENMKALGIIHAFTSADLSGIAPGLVVTRVLHEAVVIVDEKGTEAAAVTLIGSGTTSVGQYQPPPEFIANRPFLFFIVDNSDGRILFMGRVDNPTNSTE